MKSFLIELKKVFVKSQSRDLKSFVLSLCLVLAISLGGLSFVSLADVNDLMFVTGSNALMTMELSDEDYGVMPLSSISGVSNTVDYSGLDIHTRAITDTTTVWAHTEIDSSGAFKFDSRNSSVIKGYSGLIVRVQKAALPQAGVYRMRFDFSSDFAFDWGSVQLSSTRMINNVESTTNVEYVTGFLENSGDLYFDKIVDIGSVKYIDIYCNFADSSYLADVVSGLVKINFQESDAEPSFSTLGQNSSSADYENDVSSSLSDLSSSVDTMTDEISGVTEAIQNLQGAMEPHYSNVLTQLHHITEQLHAFYDQIYNNVHLAQMTMLENIKTAIENIDLEVNISLDGLKQTVQQVGQNVISNDNKLSADQIANDEVNTEEVKDSIEKHGNFIIDGLKGLFIPSDEFFKSYFDDLYEYFSDRFGFLSFPFDLLSRFVYLVVNSSEVDCVLTLPSFEIMGEQLLYEESFNLTDFLEQNFGFLLSAIRMGTSIILIMSFVQLCGDKWREVMSR